MKYIDDESYKRAAEKEIARIDRHERWVKHRKEYIKQYQIETNSIAKYTARRQKRREANREKYNAYMREFQRRKRAKIRAQKAAERAQKEQAGENQGEITDTPDKPTT